MNGYEVWFEGFIVFTAIIGLITHSGILKKKFRVNLFLYYTNLSNLLVLLFFSCRVVVTFLGIQSGSLYQVVYSDFWHFSITASILITFLIYHFLLAPLVKKGDIGSAEFKHHSFDNIAVHYLVPILTLLDWLFIASKSNLNWISGVYWIVIPLAYTLFALLRGLLGGNIKYTTSPYPYPFMDPAENGWKKVMLNLFYMSIGFVVLGMMMVGIGGIL